MLPNKRIAVRLAVIVMAILILGLGAEVALRIYDAVHGVTPEAHNTAYFLFRAHPHRGYELTPGTRLRYADGRTVTVNSLGFRGPEFTPMKEPNTLRIFCLGESSTYGIYKDDADVWPRRLEEKLQEQLPGHRVEVINAGVPGYSSYESLIYLIQEIVNYRPDAILVTHTWNDSIKFGTIGASGNLVQTQMLRIRHVGKHGPLRNLLNRLVLVGMIEHRILDPLWTWRHEGDWFYDTLFHSKNVPLDIAAFERNLRAMVHYAADSGFLAVLCTQVIRMVDPDDSARWLHRLPQCEQIVRRVAGQPGAVLADAARHVEANEINLADAVHFTPQGSEVMAQFLANRLVESLRSELE